MNRFFRSSASLVLASALLVPGISLAQETLAPLQAGPVIINPSLTLKETYRDNVFYTPSDTTGDFITSILPSVTLRLPFRMHELSLGTSAEFLLYADNSDLNVTLFEVFGRGDFAIGDRVKLKVGDTYQRNEESPVDSPNGTSDVYTANAAAFSMKYSFVDVSQVQLDYTRTMLDYPDSNYRTRNEDLVALYLYYRALPSTSGFLEYDFKNIAYDKLDTFDNKVHSGLVGVTWEMAEATKGTAKVGFLSKGYSDAKLDDYSTWTASVNLEHRLTDVSALRVVGKRDVSEGKYRDTRYFTTTGLFVDYTHRFLDRLSGVVEASYSTDEYSNARAGEVAIRDDKTAHFGIGARYAFNSWLNMSVDYGYSDRNSNIAAYDAAINSIGLKVTAYR